MYLLFALFTWLSSNTVFASDIDIRHHQYHASIQSSEATAKAPAASVTKNPESKATTLAPAKQTDAALANLKPDAYDINGEPFYFKKHANQWVIIHYWSDWCRSCVKEIPKLNAFAKKHPEVVFLGIHIDSPGIRKQTNLKQKLNIQFPLLHHINTSHFPHPDSITGIPATFVFSPNRENPKKYQAFYGAEFLRNLKKLESAMNKSSNS